MIRWMLIATAAGQEVAWRRVISKERMKQKGSVG
jgi:hypothetical protein